MTSKLEVASTPPPRDHISLLACLDITFDPNLGAPSKPSGKRKTRGAHPITGAKIIPIGSRNTSLASIAGSMRTRGATEDEILAGLRSENESNVYPPLDDAEVQRIARSISKYPPSTLASDQAHSLNDTGNARRLVDQYGVALRYVPEHGGWLIWEKQRWADDATGKIVEVGKATAKSIYREAALSTDQHLSIALAKHANRSHDAARIKAMIELARSDPRIVVRVTYLDRHDELLGVANGVLDLRMGEVRDARPEDLITRHSPVAFDSRATCPTWLKFLARVTNGNQLLVEYLQRVGGYALTGLTGEQVLFFLYGLGANGKTTFLKIIEESLGPELARQLPYDSLVARKQPRSATNDLARLQGVRAVFTSEVEDGTTLAESLIKQLTGGEAIPVRFLYAEFFEFVPIFKLFIAGNHKPIIKGDDDGIWRRLHLIPFTVTIPPDERDPHLLDKLREELPGILAWAVRGYAEWKAQGLAPPKCVIDSVAEYRDDMDIFGEWIAQCCEVGEGKSMAAGQAYLSYDTWASAIGLRPMTMPTFGRKLGERFHRDKKANGNYYDGIAIKARE